MKKYVGKIPYDAISQAAKDKLMAAVSFLKPEDVALIEHACDYANDAHVGQTRQSGEAYITPPLPWPPNWPIGTWMPSALLLV